MNRYLLATVGIILLLGVGSVSAANNQYNITASMGNSAPTIIYVAPVANQNPTQNAITTVQLNFTARDNNGNTDLNTSSAQCSLIKAPTTHSSSSCTKTVLTNKEAYFLCDVNMNYYDEPGVWTVSCTIKDNQGASATDSSSQTMTYNTLFAIALDKSALNFGTLTLGATQASTDNPLGVLNQGNVDVANVSMKGYNLTSGTDILPAAQFNVTSVQSPEVSIIMVEDTYLQLNTITIPYSNGASKTFDYYVNVPEVLAVGDYSSYGNPWVVYTSA